jgi:hypothetical protein
MKLNQFSYYSIFSSILDIQCACESVSVGANGRVKRAVSGRLPLTARLSDDFRGSNEMLEKGIINFISI